MVVATFREAFPATSIWEPTPGDFLLLGRVDRVPLDAARLAAGAGVNSDDRLPLEFGAPRALYLDTSIPNRAMVAFFRSADLPTLTPESAPLMDQKENRYWAGVGCLRRADPAAALGHFERVLKLDPTHASAAIAAATAALQLGRPAPALDFARRA